MAEETNTNNLRTLAVNLTSKSDLYMAYMPYVKQGGLFIATREAFRMDEEVNIVLKLMEESEKFQITGRVVWTTPKGAQGGMASGIGVQFQGPQADHVKNKIETYLAGTTNFDRATSTM